MSMDDSKKTPESLLADLADQMLNEGNDQLPVEGLDPETRELAETLLRLKRAFPREDLDAARVRQMEKRVLHRWEEGRPRKTRWLDSIRAAWEPGARRRGLGLAFAVIVIAALVILAGPLLFAGNGSVTGTAGREISERFVWFLLVLLAACLVWLLRRKP